MDLSRALEVTSRLLLVLALVVGVEDKGQLLLAGAHTVGAVGAAGRIVRDAITHMLSVAVATDLAEKLAVGGRLDRVCDHAGQTLHHTRAEVRVGARGQRAGFRKPVVVVDRGTGAHGVAGRVAGAVDAAGRDTADFLGVGVEVVLLGDRAAVDGDETVAVVGFEVHVDNATAPDIGHLVTVERGHVLEFARLWVQTSVLGEEERNRVVAVFLGASLVSRGRECLVATPLVDVVPEEVDRFLLGATVEVVRHVLSDVALVSSRVTEAQRASIVVGLDIGLHVTGGGLDERCGCSLVGLVDDLVADEETNHVVVLGHGVDNASVPVIQLGRPDRVVHLDGGRLGGQIADHVDACIRQLLHAVVVIALGVELVGPDDVCAQLQEVGNITRALGTVDERVAHVLGASLTGSVRATAVVVL